MIYVIDFMDGKHKNNQQVANMLKGESSYQPIEIEGDMDSEDLELFKSFINTGVSEEDEIIVFIDNSDGPKHAINAFNWLREFVYVKCYITNTI